MGPVNTWRTELTPGDPLRDFTLSWSAGGGLSPLPAPFVPIAHTPSPLTDEGLWIRAARLPVGATLPPGSGYTVYTPPVLPTTALTPSDHDADLLQWALSQGHVRLTPGAYYLDRTIRPPAGRRITGYGARLIRTGITGEYHADKMFEAAPRLTFVGLTFDGPSLVAHGDNPAPGIVFSRCTVAGGALGFWSTPDGLLVVDCMFDNASAGQPNGGLYLRCRWKGLASGQWPHAFASQSSDCLALIDCEFDGTDRGPALRGMLNAPLLRGVSCRGVGHVSNGNELMSAEGGPGAFIDRGLFIHFRSYGCEGDVNWWDSKVTRSYFWDFAGDHVSFMVGQQEFSDNYLYAFELRGGGVQLANQAKRNRLENIACIGWMPRRVNNFDSLPRLYDLANRAVISADGPDAASNTATGCTVLGQPPGVSPFRGVTVR